MNTNTLEFRAWLDRCDSLRAECNSRFLRWHARFEAASSEADALPQCSHEYRDCRADMDRALRAMGIYNRRHYALARAITHRTLFEERGQ